MEHIHGAASFSLESDSVSLHITEQGGHLSPVTFKLGNKTVSPYSLSPWKPDEVDRELPVLLKNLRGDFFCLPFGPQEQGPPHGETANAIWKKVDSSESSLSLELEASDISAKVTKTLSLRSGETAIYIEHRISGLEGDWSYGTHPILDLSHLPTGSARLSVSPFRWAAVYPRVFSDPADGAHQLLKVGAPFDDLSRVPSKDGGNMDLSRYPWDETGDDLVMMVSRPTTAAQPFAWSACVANGSVWFALKNPTDFPATMFWLSNGGRSAPPWNGTHAKRVGIEDVCSHFCDGVTESRKNLLADAGIPTTRHFKKDTSVALRNIQAVAEVPPEFGLVKAITPDGQNRVEITDENGIKIATTINWEFVVDP